ncbi:hypothetical protein EGS38_11885, partial [Neisseria chenwenguii]
MTNSQNILKNASSADALANSISTYAKEGGDVNATAALVSAAALLPGSTGLSSSLAAVATSVTQISQKATSNKAITASDALSLLGSVVSVVADGIETISEMTMATGVGAPAGAAGHTIGSGLGVTAAGISATAATMANTGIDVSLYNPTGDKSAPPSVSEVAQKAKDILSNNLENIKNFDKKVSENIENINKEVDASLEKVAETLQTSKESLKDILSNALDKAAEGIDSLRDWLSDAFQNFAQQLPDLPSEKEWYIDDGKQCFAPWADQNRDGKYHVYDPLVLDLDGDGIETVGTSGYAGALFDHDKDGIRTSTGWVSADDGLLVVDLNGDGKVNNGGELFGDSYVLKDGNTAANGFAALAEFDTNSDGIIDANDERFKE